MTGTSVILDSCVLYPMYLRDTLLCVAEAGLYQPHWSQDILDGTLRNLIAKGQITAERAAALEQQMNIAFPEAMVPVTERLIPCMDSDPGDRHVLAAALIAKAQIIVTDNLKHFLPESLNQFQIQAQSADQFLVSFYDLYPESMLDALNTQVSFFKNPPLSVSQLLILLERSVPNFVSRLR